MITNKTLSVLLFAGVVLLLAVIVVNIHLALQILLLTLIALVILGVSSDIVRKIRAIREAKRLHEESEWANLR